MIFANVLRLIMTKLYVFAGIFSIFLFPIQLDFRSISRYAHESRQLQAQDRRNPSFAYRRQNRRFFIRAVDGCICVGSPELAFSIQPLPAVFHFKKLNNRANIFSNENPVKPVCRFILVVFLIE